MKNHTKSMILKMAVFSLVIFAGQSAANNTEFLYQKIDQQTVKVGFWNNAYYSKERAQDMVFDKIAQMALQQGATHFELLQPQVATDYVATSSNQEKNASGEVVKTMISAPSRQNRQWDEAGTIIFPRYFFTAQVKLHKTALPQSPNKVYNAKSVVAQQQRLVEPFKSVTRAEAETQAAAASGSQHGAGAQSTEGVTATPKVAEWTNKSYQHLQKSEWVEAIRTASAAINLSPNFDIPYVNRATAYIQHGYKDKAQTDIDTALALNPDNALAINMHGYLLQEKGSTQDAMSFYQKACGKKLEIGCSNFKEVAGFRPDNTMEETNYYLNKSEEAMAKNRWKEVIEWASKAIEADPENYKAYSNRAGALAEDKRAGEALLDADQAIALNPNFGPAYHNRGHAYKIMGNLRDAALEFEIGCSLGIKDSCAEFKGVSAVAKK
ncbi:MAG TPA: tetratricopeptide repeat protein [Gammaproteobacteria bacterium]